MFSCSVDPLPITKRLCGWHLRFAFCLGVDQVFCATGLWFAGFSKLLRIHVLSLSPDRRCRSVAGDVCSLHDFNLAQNSPARNRATTPRLRSNCQTAATRAHRHSRRLADTRHIFRRELRKISHLRRDSVAVPTTFTAKSPIACTAPAESKSISKTFQLDWRRISVRMASRLIATFPGLGMPRETSRVGSPSIDVVESFSSVPVSMSALLLLAVAGCMPLVHGSRPMIRRVRLPALTLLVGGGIVLTTVGITERYLHDFYPALILCAAVGMSRIEVEKRLWARTTVMAALTIISIYINCSFSFVHQRTTSGAPLAKRVEFRHIQHTFYQLTRGRMTTDGS